MSLIARSELEALAAPYDRPSISIYMPTHRAGPEVLQDRIRLKNLVDRAEEELVARGTRAPDARALVNPARHVERLSSFWQHQSDGLAVFINDALARYYRLPLRFDDLIVVGNRFHVKPLLPVLSADQQFFVLGVSVNDVRLLQGTRYTVAPALLHDVPRSLEEALRFDDPEAHLQWHTVERADPLTGRKAMFHGHGLLTADDRKERVGRYFQRLDRALGGVLCDQRAPIVLAGVERIRGIYREVSNLPSLMEEGIEGNPETLSDNELHDRAWHIVEPLVIRQQERAAELYEQLAGQGNARAAHDVASVVIASHEGRVDTLFVARDLQCWGTFDPQARRVNLGSEPGPGRCDLLDMAAMHTLMNRGVVYAVESGSVPGGGSIAAILRY